MAETLGKMEKPEAAGFQKARKIFYVPLVFLPPMDADAELTKLIGRYWEEVSEQVDNLSLRLSPVKHIYHELSRGGDEGLRVIDELRSGSLALVKKLMAEGAVLEPTEDSEALAEYLDWNRCLALRLDSPKVFNQVYDNYSQADKKRSEAIAKKIDDSLKPDEVGLVFLREGHHVAFPSDVQVFYVAPPGLDAVRRYVMAREEVKLPKSEEPGVEEERTEPASGTEKESEEPKA